MLNISFVGVRKRGFGCACYVQTNIFRKKLLSPFVEQNQYNVLSFIPKMVVALTTFFEMFKHRNDLINLSINVQRIQALYFNVRSSKTRKFCLKL